MKPWSLVSLHSIRAGAALALVVATVITFDDDVRYTEAAENLLTNGDFRNGLAEWELVGPKVDFVTGTDFVKVHSRNPGEKVRLRQNVGVSRIDGALRLDVHISTRQVGFAEKQAFRALLHFFCRDISGKMLRDQHNSYTSYTLPKRTPEWMKYHYVIDVPDLAEVCVVELDIKKGTNGDVGLKDVRIHPVTTSQNWDTLYYLLLGLWIAIGVWTLWGIIGPITLCPKILFWSIVVSAIALTSLLSSSIKQAVFEVVIEGFSYANTVLLPIMPAVVAGSELFVTGGDLDELAHMGFFGAIAYFTVVSWPRQNLRSLALQLSIFAASTEVIQFFAVDRQPRLFDWTLDMCGMLLVLCVVQLHRLYKRPVTCRG